MLESIPIKDFFLIIIVSICWTSFKEFFFPHHLYLWAWLVAAKIIEFVHIYKHLFDEAINRYGNSENRDGKGQVNNNKRVRCSVCKHSEKNVIWVVTNAPKKWCILKPKTNYNILWCHHSWRRKRTCALINPATAKCKLFQGKAWSSWNSGLFPSISFPVFP